MKKFIILIIILSVLMGVGIYYGFLTYFKVLDFTINPLCPRTDCYKVKNYPLLFDQAISKIGNRVYDLDDYNCIDFSKDLVKELEEIGIKSNIAVSDERQHAWVVIWIEATTGEFIHPEEDLEILELRDRNFNVICK